MKLVAVSYRFQLFLCDIANNLLSLAQSSLLSCFMKIVGHFLRSPSSRLLPKRHDLGTSLISSNVFRMQFPVLKFEFKQDTH